MLPTEVLGICRLCLVKEHVDVNIFENNSKQLFYKIAACLPVSIAVDDKLPKKICLSCYNKVNLLYDFWNQTLNAEKHILAWLNEDVKCSTNNSHNSSLMKESLNNLNTMNYKIYDKNINHRRDRHMTDTRLTEFLIQTQEDSDDNHVTDIENNENCNSAIQNNKGGKLNENEQYDKCFVIQSNQSVKIECEGIKPGPSGFQESSALRQLQGYAEELTNNSFTNLSKIFQVLNNPGENQETCDSAVSENENNLEMGLHRCSKCEKNFSDIDLLIMHKLNQCNDDTSDKTVSEAFERNLHTGTIPNGNKYHCGECGISFVDKQHLQTHSSMHADSKSFVCQKCGTTFRYKKTFESHVKIHANEKASSDEQVFVCNVCEQRFSTRNSYIHHARSHKNITNKCKLMCFVCNQTFSSKRMLSQHLRTQCGQKMFVCDVCGKELSTKESLECHKLIHVEEKSLVCKICNKTFSHRKYFVVHQRIHTGERPYKCVTCNKTFTQTSALTVHRRFHTGERPYKCFVCSKGFVTRTIMLSHLKYHKES